MSADFALDELPDIVLELVLSHCPAKFLVKSAPLVCKRWRDIATSRTMWKLKCVRDGKKLPPNSQILLILLKYIDYRTVYLKNPFGRNLLRSWDTEGWQTNWEKNGRSHQPPIAVETSIPTESFGSQPLPLEAGTTKCWATSYIYCCLTQLIDLVAEGLVPSLLDELRPPIHISVWTAGRFDCASKYDLTVLLTGAENNTVIDTFKTSRQIRQWDDNSWVKLSHTFRNYGKGVRYVKFAHGGKDLQFWAGNYGPKMAAPSVTVDITSVAE